MFDPYKNNTPGLDEPANNIIALAPNPNADIPVGVKGLRVTNRNAAMQSITVITVMDEVVTLWYPQTSVTHDMVRIKRLVATTVGDVIVHGLTDAANPD